MIKKVPGRGNPTVIKVLAPHVQGSVAITRPPNGVKRPRASAVPGVKKMNENRHTTIIKALLRSVHLGFIME